MLILITNFNSPEKFIEQMEQCSYYSRSVSSQSKIKIKRYLPHNMMKLDNIKDSRKDLKPENGFLKKVGCEILSSFT